MAELNCANKKRAEVPSRMRSAIVYSAAVAAVLICATFTNAAAYCDVADAKTYPAAEKKIESALSKGRTWVYFESTSIPWPEAYKAFKKVTCKKASYIVKAKSSQTWCMNGSKYAYGMKIAYRSAKQRKALNSKVRSILKNVSQYDCQSEKIEGIHDAINKRCRYDWKSYRTKVYADDTGNAYGSLVRGRSVCAGYAEAFQLVALKAGLKSRYVSNDNHAWNLVKVGGKWYHIDLCWDDTGGKKRKYFLKGSTTMAKYKYHSIKDCYPAKVKVSRKDYVEPMPPVEVITDDEMDDDGSGDSLAVSTPATGAIARINYPATSDNYTTGGNAMVGGGKQK